MSKLLQAQFKPKNPNNPQRLLKENQKPKTKITKPFTCSRPSQLCAGFVAIPCMNHLHAFHPHPLARPLTALPGLLGQAITYRRTITSLHPVPSPFSLHPTCLPTITEQAFTPAPSHAPTCMTIAYSSRKPVPLQEKTALSFLSCQLATMHVEKQGVLPFFGGRKRQQLAFKRAKK